MSNWLDELKPGDKVFVRAGYYSAVALTTVSHLTKIMIVTASGHRFRRGTGAPVGEQNWGTTKLFNLSNDEVRLQWWKERLSESLKKVRVRDLTEQQCRDLVDYLAKLQPPAETKQ